MSATAHADVGYDAPADLAVAVTANDAADLPGGPCRGLYVGGGGDVAVVMAADATNSGAGTAVTFVAVPTGAVLPVRARRVMATGTTATSIVSLS